MNGRVSTNDFITYSAHVTKTSKQGCLAGSVRHVTDDLTVTTDDLMVVNSSPTLGMEIT